MILSGWETYDKISLADMPFWKINCSNIKSLCVTRQKFPCNPLSLPKILSSIRSCLVSMRIFPCPSGTYPLPPQKPDTRLSCIRTWLGMTMNLNFSAPSHNVVCKVKSWQKKYRFEDFNWKIIIFELKNNVLCVKGVWRI